VSALTLVLIIGGAWIALLAIVITLLVAGRRADRASKFTYRQRRGSSHRRTLFR
jgi:hypothetical protein